MLRAYINAIEIMVAFSEIWKILYMCGFTLTIEDGVRLYKNTKANWTGGATLVEKRLHKTAT